VLRYFVAFAAGLTAVAAFGLGLGQGAEKQATEQMTQQATATKSAAKTDSPDFIVLKRLRLWPARGLLRRDRNPHAF
jgi:hypothetical protein